jgi:hypothetical protein
MLYFTSGWPLIFYGYRVFFFFGKSMSKKHLFLPLFGHSIAPTRETWIETSFKSRLFHSKFKQIVASERFHSD